jgi:histone H2A
MAHYDSVKFDSFISKLLKQLASDVGMTGDSLSELNNIARLSLARLMDYCNHLLLNSKRKTLSSKQVITAVKLWFPEEMAKNMIKEAETSSKRYLSVRKERLKEAKNLKKGEKLPPMTRASMARIIFPPTRVENVMKDMSLVQRKTESSSIVMATILEYIIASILKLSADEAINSKKRRITPRHITLAIHSDPCWRDFFDDCILAGGVAVQSDNRLLKSHKRSTHKNKKERKEAPKSKEAKPKASKKSKKSKK